jgi:hypothetical protein
MGIPISNIAIGGRGDDLSVTEAGPPDKIIAFGLNSIKNNSVTF